MSTREIVVKNPFDVLFDLPHFIMSDDAESKEINHDLFSHSSIRGGFKADVKDGGDCYQVIADFPGVDKKDIDVQYDQGKLIVSYEHSGEGKGASEDDDAYVTRERYLIESASRSFVIPDVDKKGITASFDNGVLTVTLPKKEKASTHVSIA